jgi:hypothetical protein
MSGLEGLWTFGPYGSLNSYATWKSAATNLLLASNDLTQGSWAFTNGSATDADTANFTASGHLGQLDMAVQPGATYTLSLEFKDSTVGSEAARIWDDTNAGFLEAAHVWGAIGSEWATYTYTFTLASNTAQIDVYILRTTGGAGNIDIRNISLTPRTAAPSDIEVTDDKQEVWDWSGNTRHAQRGSTTGADTNDFSYNTWSRNLLAPGSTEDLTDAAWTHTATTDDADNLTFTAQNDLISQDVTTVAGVTYTLSAKIRAVTGNTALHFYHNNSATGNSTAQVVTATLTTYSVSVLGRAGGGAVSFGIQDQNAAGHGQIEIEDWQVELASAATTYTNPAERREIVADFDGVDNYALSPSLTGMTLTQDFTVFAVVSGLDVDAAETFVNLANPATGVDYHMAYFNTDPLSLRISSRDSGGSTESGVLAITPKNWHVVVFRNIAGTLHLALGEDPATEVTHTAENPVGTPRVGIGALGDGSPTNFYDGAIALVAVYSRAVGAAEIATTTTLIASSMCTESGILCDVAGESYPAYGWLFREGATWLLAHLLPVPERAEWRAPVPAWPERPEVIQ